MKQRDITVYTQPDCPPCTFVKELLNHHKIPYTEKDIRKDPVFRKELVEKYKAMSTPLVLVDDEVLYSSDLAQLAELLEINKIN
ncbi:glutaredoxin family protein [Rossellomorea vietnamensis]|uniref:Glutaredoxin family protein n=1 Tax=Rossellomorea vietnamensis TaxID=218284 RepID=A0A5D4NPC0_9BACI|nr:glutaredoxin family protein [Rossellomorea vietnamensis]TYS15740.1 glutaredoxin family protein [Rossellomorea vietnamensis]